VKITAYASSDIDKGEVLGRGPYTAIKNGNTL
jgi:hypothetical protein